jgi:type VI secretion system secreted protein Hcp
MKAYKTNLLASTLLCLALSSMTGNGAAFLKLGDIKGEATDNAHRDWIIIESMNHSISAPPGASAGLPTGKRQHKPFVITKPVDKATPLLFGACTGGGTIPMARLEFVSPGPRPQYYKVTFKNVLVSSYKTGSSSADSLPMESFSLNYEEIKWTYTQFSPEDQPLRDHSFYWNLLAETGEFDELPPGSFRVSNGSSTSPGGKVLMLEWEGFEEFRYVIKTSPTADGTYGPLQTFDPLADGKQELELPIGVGNQFIQIEKIRESVLQQ